MPPDLKSANWKIDRAIELLKGLDEEVRAWFSADPQPARFSVYINPEHTRASVTVWVNNPPNTLRWSLMYADIIHNLRCALDHTFWALLQEEFPLGIPKEVERLSFPIWDAPPGSDQRRNFKPVSVKLFDAVQSVQPYNNPNTQFPDHPLAIIRDIDNGNKHRLLFSLILSMGRIHIQVKNCIYPESNAHTSEVYRGELHNDTDVYTTTFDKPEPYLKYICDEFMAIIAVRHSGQILGKDRDDYAALTDEMILWVRNTIDKLVVNATKSNP